MAKAAFRLRRARATDLDALGALETRVFTCDLISRRSLQRFLASPSAHIIVAGQAGELLGYVLALFRTGSRIGRIYSLAVAPEAAGQGIGRALLKAAEAQMRRRGCTAVRLEVAVRNRRARALYAGSGYRELARFADYYEDGGAAFRLEKPLGSARKPACPPAKAMKSFG